MMVTCVNYSNDMCQFFYIVPTLEVTGNFPTVTRVLLSKIPVVDGRMTYVYDEYVVSISSYKIEQMICVYICNVCNVPFSHF